VVQLGYGDDVMERVLHSNAERILSLELARRA